MPYELMAYDVESDAFWIVVTLYLLICALVAAWARSWGRRGWLWFIIAIVAAPLIGVIALLVVGSIKTDEKLENVV